jgi:hypothetical protein
VTVTLENRTARRQLFHLTHAHACADGEAGTCSCKRITVGVQDHNPTTGVRTLRAHKRRLPDSITLNARLSDGSKVSGLPDKIIGDPAVAKAIKAKRIAWSKDPETVGARHPKELAAQHAQRTAKAAVEAEKAHAAKGAPPGPTGVTGPTGPSDESGPTGPAGIGEPTGPAGDHKAEG